MTWCSCHTITARCRTKSLSWRPHQQGQGSRPTGRRPSWWRSTQLPTHRSQLVDSPSERWSHLFTWEAQTETSQSELTRQEQLSSCSKTSGDLEESAWEPNSASSTPVWSQSCSTGVRHGGQHRRCNNRSRHSSTPVWCTSTKSNGKRRSELKVCGSKRDRNQRPSRYCEWSGAGSDTPSGSQHPAPYAKPWPGTHRGREREASLATAGGETLKQSGMTRAAQNRVRWLGAMAGITIEVELYILSLWMVHAGCVYVAGIHLSRTYICMNVRIFWDHAMECTCAETRACFTLSSKSVRSAPKIAL